MDSVQSQSQTPSQPSIRFAPETEDDFYFVVESNRDDVRIRFRRFNPETATTDQFPDRSAFLLSDGSLMVVTQVLEKDVQPRETFPRIQTDSS